MADIIEYRHATLMRQERTVLRNVDLKLTSGEFLYLIGRVGSGKSTLLNSFYAEVPVDEASTAEVLGRDLMTIRKKDIPFLRREIGIVFQDFRLLIDRNVYENLRFVLRATGWTDKFEIEKRIEESLKNVGMLNKSYKMPHQLSGGEQQRIVVARAMLNRPRLILADEPTGNLDPETGEIIVSMLHDIAAAGTAVVMATHNLGLVEKFPARVLRCENKQIKPLS